MKLIIENWEGAIYVYTESEKHYTYVVKNEGRTTTKLSNKLLATECRIENYPDSHFVFDLK